MMILEVAVPLPLYRTFDYLPPDGEKQWPIGARVEVPFGARRVVGIITAVKRESDLPQSSLRRVGRVIDQEPLLNGALLKLADWISSYYHEPIGVVLQLFLPPLLREGRPFIELVEQVAITPLGVEDLAAGALKRTPAKERLLQHLTEEGRPLEEFKKQFSNYTTHRRALIEWGYIREWSEQVEPTSYQPQAPHPAGSFPPNDDQERAIATILAQEGGCYLLEGVTGSGKTTIYLEVARHYLQQGKQVLFLVPEIGLTPQFIERLERELGVRYAVIHSEVRNQERLEAWRRAGEGSVELIIGTRSALFTPFRNLGLIVVDEAHDPSYIQRDGVRYSAHNSAIKYAYDQGIPIILGSATPTLEHLHNVERGQYHHIQLPKRARGTLPTWEVIDCNEEQLYDGISTPLMREIEATIARQEQVLVFINRRGFAPIVQCQSCRWMAECDHCSAYLNYHRSTGRLHCHHCGLQILSPKVCPECGDQHFSLIGEGTQKVEKLLIDAFPMAKVLRFDRDILQREEDFIQQVEAVRNRQVDIIIGTQMLAKGHDFSHITLVALINSDGLFFSNDFRAEEKLAQLLMQVSGRAGRADHQGKVMIQTHFPHHPLFTELPQIGYHRFAQEQLALRKMVRLPPYSHQVLLQAEARDQKSAFTYLEGIIAAADITPLRGGEPSLEMMPVMEHFMQRRKGYYRVYSVMQSESRRVLHQALATLIETVELNPRHGVRFFVEVDPFDI